MRYLAAIVLALGLATAAFAPVMSAQVVNGGGHKAVYAQAMTGAAGQGNSTRWSHQLFEEDRN